MSTRLTLKQGDITRETVDVVVNAANSGLAGGGGVDGAIHRAAGPGLMQELRAIRAQRGHPPCPTGTAVITSGGNMPVRHVVHTAGPIYRDGRSGEPEQLRDCYLNSLKLALEHGARSVAFPCISTGVYGYPLREAAEIAVKAVREFTQTHAGLEEVRFVVFSDTDRQVYEKLLT